MINNPSEVINGQKIQVEGFKEEVRDLVKKFCDKPNVICLVVSNSNADFACNQGYELICKLKKATSSIFVLTKPDKLTTQSDHQEVLKIFKEHKNVYMVRNRNGSAEEANLNSGKWKERETEFFTNLLRTYRAEYRPYRLKLGTQNLAEELSRQLGQCLLKTRADCDKKLQREIDGENQKLANLNKQIKTLNSGDATFFSVLSDFQNLACSIFHGAIRALADIIFTYVTSTVFIILRYV